MEYNPQTSAIVVRLAQEALSEVDLLMWATIACTYIDLDNLQMTIMSPQLPRPVVVGFAGFMGMAPYKAEMIIRPKIAGALITAIKEKA